MWALDDLIDLERYPIHDLTGAGASLLARCRASVADSAICHLPGFVKPAAIEAVLEESRAREDTTYWMETRRRVYSWRNPDDYLHTPAVGHTNKNLIGSITKNVFPRDGAFVSLHELPALTEFVRQCMNQASLHPVACPYLAANIKVMSEGCVHAWHFDQNDGAVTFLFQEARQGGHFQYVPFLRNDDDENYDGVMQLMEGDMSAVRSAPLEAGSFCLFGGRRSIHRVSEVTAGSPDRLLAVFSYHRDFGHRYKDSTVKSVLGRVPDDYVESF
jgi:hypothetical protein